MSFPMRGRPRKSNGSAGSRKVCCYGNCSSRSYASKDTPMAAEENVSFIRFPQTCLKYRSALPGSSFRSQHRRAKCKQCEVAARWVRKCQRPSDFVSIDDIRTFTNICSKHFSSVEDARLHREDPRPILSAGAKKRKRSTPKSRLKVSFVENRSDDEQADMTTMSINAPENEEQSTTPAKDKLSRLIVEETNSSSKVADPIESSNSRNWKRTYSCKLIPNASIDAQPKRLSEKLKQLQQLNCSRLTCDTDIVVEPKRLGEKLKELKQLTTNKADKEPKRGTLTEKLQLLQQLTNNNLSSDFYTVDLRKGRLSDKLKQLQQMANNKTIETNNATVLNWRSLALKFLESKWTVQLEENGITLLKHLQQFITMEITITKFRIVVSVRGRILKLPDNLKHMNSSEDNIIKLVSILEHCNICQGTSPQEMVNIERDLKSCWSPKCAGLIFEKGSNVCPSCQHEYEVPEVMKETVQKTVNYRYMGKRELLCVIKEKKKMLKQLRLKVFHLQRKVEQASKREQRLGGDTNENKEQNAVILADTENPDLVTRIDDLPDGISIVLCS